MPESIIQDRLNDMKNIAGKTFNQITGSDNNILMITIFIISVISFFIISWIYGTLSNRNLNCKRLNSIYKENNDMRTTNKSIPTNVEYKHDMLKNFVIKTAYNCCCIDNYKNNWVDECALKKCIYQGARCLDFEIYSYNNEPIIAASTANNNSIKETYNYLKFSKVLEVIKSFNNYIYIDNYEDPLFLHFRIMSDNIDIYNLMGNYINSILFDNSDKICNLNDDKLINTQLHELKNKFIIMVNAKNYRNVEQSSLNKYVNLKSGGPFLHEYRYNTVVAAEDVDNSGSTIISGKTSASLIIVLPNINNKIDNYEWSKPYSFGCNFIAMKFQTIDANLLTYNKYLFTDDNNKAIVIKRNERRHDRTTDISYSTDFTLGSPSITEL